MPGAQRREAMGTFDSRTFRDTMGQFATGVAIVAGTEGGTLVGFAAQSLVSLSLDPPLVAVCPARTSTSWPRIRAHRSFCINVLAQDQQAISDAFAQAGRAADVPWHTNGHGAPILDGAIAWVDCELVAEHDAGDHTIAVGSPREFRILRPDAAPLIYLRGEYGLG